MVFGFTIFTLTTTITVWCITSIHLLYINNLKCLNPVAKQFNYLSRPGCGCLSVSPFEI